VLQEFVMKPNLRQTIWGGVAAVCLTASAAFIAPTTATAGPLSIAPVSDVALPKATESVQYRRGVRRGHVRHVRYGHRRGYYRGGGIGPAAVLGLFGAALGAATVGNYYYTGYPYGGYYPAYSYPAYPAYYYGGYYPAYYGGYYPRYRTVHYPRVRYGHRVNRPVYRGRIYRGGPVYRGGVVRRGPVYRGGQRFVGGPAAVRSVGMRSGGPRRR
jgi:hypothetical protein